MELEINTKYDVGDKVIIQIYGKYEFEDCVCKVLEAGIDNQTRLYPGQYLLEKPNKERVWFRENEIARKATVKDAFAMFFNAIKEG